MALARIKPSSPRERHVMLGYNITKGKWHEIDDGSAEEFRREPLHETDPEGVKVFDVVMTVEEAHALDAPPGQGTAVAGTPEDPVRTGRAARANFNAGAQPAPKVTDEPSKGLTGDARRTAEQLESERLAKVGIADPNNADPTARKMTQAELEQAAEQTKNVSKESAGKGLSKR